MRYYQLVIGDEDVVYTTRVANYINRNPDTSFKVRCFSETKLLKYYLQEHTVDILLLSERFYNEEIPYDQTPCIVLISEGKLQQKFAHLPFIYKYQSMDQFQKILLGYYADVCQETIMTMEKQKNVIGVFSPIGRSGRTTLSLALAHTLSYDKKVLFLNLEPFNSLSTSTRSHHYGLSDLLYYVRQQHPNLILKIESIKETSFRFDYIAPVRCYVDLLEVTIDEWQYLIDLLQKNSQYDVIILNFSNAHYNYTYDLLKLCQQILVPMVSDENAYEQLKAWQESVKLLKQEDILEKTYYILNRLTPTYHIEPFVNKYFELPYEENTGIHSDERYGTFSSNYNQALREIIQHIRIGEAL